MAEPYIFTRDYSGLAYSFVSAGLRRIPKLVSFVDEGDDVYTVSLHDLDPAGNRLPLNTNSNNGDIYDVMATLEEIIKHFLHLHPDRVVFITGMDDRRTHLYHRHLANALNLLADLEIQGINPDNTAELLNPRKEYRGYFVIRKQ